MHKTDPGSVREEAERLVAAALATARSAVSGGHIGQFATGDAGCCTCPLCRTIKVLREPDPEFAERLATGAGELAAGVATLLRSLSSAASRPPGPRPAPEAATGPTGAAEQRDSTESSAGPDTGAGAQPDAEQDVWAAATRAGAGHDEKSGGGGERQR